MNPRPRAHHPPEHAVNAPKSLFRRVERTLAFIQHADDILGTVRNVAEYMTANFRVELGITGGRVYHLEDMAYELVSIFGTARPVPLGTAVPRDYVGIEALLESGLIVMDRRTSSELDHVLEDQLGTSTRFAAIAVADGDYIVSFDLEQGRGSNEDLQASLNIVRLAINQKLRQDKFANLLEDARRIQSSILPKRAPRYADFDIAGASRPAEIVGGDFYDWIPLTAEMFDLVIADASGHGLPAALQVRDIYMGLRMGLSRDFKLSRTIERLAAIINRSKLASKFVSLFIAELETSGNLIYVNAGHVLPYIQHANGAIEYLREGGMVLGPSSDSRYLRGFARLDPGDTLVMYTDGITECHNPKTGEEFGLQRLQALVRRNSTRPAAEIIATIFDAMKRYSGTDTPEDDQTVVLIRRPPAVTPTS